MIKLIRLYSEPEAFEPISFNTGVNIILGEKIETDVISNRKTIGVGKSVCIEFINFCLLKKKERCRVIKIPEDILPGSTEICLDLEISSNFITVSRTKKYPDTPTLTINGEKNTYNSLDDALKHLKELFYNNKTGANLPSFRQLLGLAARDETSEFKDIINWLDTSLRNPPDYSPHLYFLNVDLSIYKSARDKVDQIKKCKEKKRDLKKDITENNKRKMTDVKAELNALSDELSKMGKAIESLKNNNAFESIQKDIIDIESSLDLLRTRQKALRYELKKINTLPKPEIINDEEVEIIYNQFKEGLGEMVAKSLDKVKLFKAKIENFQQTLLNEKAGTLSGELKNVTEKIRELDEEYSEKLKIVDQKGILKDFKTSLRVYDQKNEELSDMRAKFKNYETEDKRLKRLNLEKDQLILDLDNAIESQGEALESFKSQILEIHESIMGNKECSFDIETIDKSNRKEVVNFDMRIYDDGSHSVERAKVFIYDMALLFNDFTRERHPKLLIHDNIFDVDQDTLVRSLNYLEKQEEKYDDFQYILTINRDRVENEEKQEMIELKIKEHTIASFTKKKKFLNKDYKEL
jgi:uncharacterized protein YydD (DUF2326 family)